MLSIALPNGSLEEGTVKLFEEANLKVLRAPRRHGAKIDDPRISRVTIMRPQHIPRLVEQGTYDLGVCGYDSVLESDAKVSILQQLCYSRRTLGGVQVVLIGADNDTTSTPESVPPGSAILSEYPGWTKRFFEKLRIPVTVEFSYGGTEAHIPSDYRYGVCVTETGSSIVANGLRIIGKLFESNTVLIANQDVQLDEKKKEAIHVIHLLLSGAQDARDEVLLIMNVSTADKEAVIKRVPALKEPTVSMLAHGKGYSISSVISRAKLNEVIPDLLKHGAQDLLELPISKVIRSW
jgi:ATP phosphoribosyltransferase